MGSVIKKRRKRMAKKKHRKLLKKTRIHEEQEVTILGPGPGPAGHRAP